MKKNVVKQERMKGALLGSAATLAIVLLVSVVTSTTQASDIHHGMGGDMMSMIFEQSSKTSNAAHSKMHGGPSDGMAKMMEMMSGAPQDHMEQCLKIMEGMTEEELANHMEMCEMMMQTMS